MTALQLLAAIGTALLLQVAAGVGVALWRHSTAATARLPAPAAVPAPAAARVAWPGWRDFRVVSRAFEDIAETQCSFLLSPVDGVALPSFQPGQYLTFSLPVAAGEAGVADALRVVTRCYSLSDRPAAAAYRITVKRVPPPAGRPELPAGAASNYLHERVQVGDVLRVRAPAGRFFIDAASAVPVVLIAGGVGITPMMSMLCWCLAERPGRTVHLYHGVREAREQAFAQALATLAASHPDFHLNTVVSGAGGAGRGAGRIDVELLRRTLPHGRHQFYVCGPPAMMAALVPALQAWGVDGADIRFESFGPASPLPPQPGVADVAVPPLDVRFLRPGRTLSWNGQDDNLLDFAERQGVALASGCRSGSCGSCEVRLVSGEVRYERRPDHEVAPGACLLCVGKPVSALVLDA